MIHKLDWILIVVIQKGDHLGEMSLMAKVLLGSIVLVIQSLMYSKMKIDAQVEDIRVGVVNLVDVMKQN